MSDAISRDLASVSAGQAEGPSFLALLILTRQGKLISKHPLTRACVTIGSAKDNDIVIRHSDVSRHHARIVTIDCNSWLEDLHSTNGTFVNARWVTTRTLKFGDQLRIGGYQFTCVNNLASEREIGDRGLVTG